MLPLSSSLTGHVQACSVAGWPVEDLDQNFRLPDGSLSGSNSNPAFAHFACNMLSAHRSSCLEEAEIPCQDAEKAEYSFFAVQYSISLRGGHLCCTTTQIGCSVTILHGLLLDM